MITEDGVIVADDIPSGTYEVSAWWAANGSTDEEVSVHVRFEKRKPIYIPHRTATTKLCAEWRLDAPPTFPTK